MADAEDTNESPQEAPAESLEQTPAADSTGGESLEAPSTGSETPGSDPATETASDDGDTPAGDGSQSPSSQSDSPDSKPKTERFRWLKSRFNIYLLFFVFVVIIVATILIVAYEVNQKSDTEQLKTQGLSQKTLDQLANSDVTVGDNQTVLNVQSSAVFAGQVLVRKDLEVAGNLRIGGTVALNNITISGTSQLGQVNVNKDLAVAGNSAMQGNATVGKSLQVGGGGTFSGPLSAPQITTSTLQLNGDLVLTHHIITGGSQPGRNGGSALGGGGSVSLSGSDTAGSININTGGGPGAGCFVTVNFTGRYNSTPHVLVTPVGSAAGGLSYYVNRSTTNFSICVASPPPAGSSFGFDYFVID
jgi:hypothetical protein